MPETRKVTITYEFDQTLPAPCIAKAEGWYACAYSFATAKERLLDKLRSYMSPVPPPEEVEVECKS